MQRIIKAGHAADAGLIFHVFAMDSTSTSGAGKASVAFGSWSCRYIRAGGAISGAITPEDITTIGTYAAPTANTNIRIKAVDNTNMIGVYELQLHLDWVATGSEALTIYLTASGVAPIALTIPLVGYNPQDSVRAGLTALPNAAADAAGGLPISDAGGLDLDAQKADVAAILVDTGTTLDARIPAALVGGRMDANVGAISSDATAADNAEAFFDGTGYAGTGNTIPTVTTVNGLAANVITATSIASDAITAAKIAADAIGASELAADAATEIADALLNRDMSAVSDTNARSPLNALRFLRNKWAVSAGTLTVRKEDDTTSAWTATVSTDAAADPIVGNDPA